MDKTKYREIRKDLPLKNKLLPNLFLIILNATVLSLSLGWLKGPGLATTFAGQLGLALVAFHAFTLLHECAHGSFSRYRWLNVLVGHFSSVLCGLPYYSWKFIHHEHHLWAGNIDKDPTLQGLKRIGSGESPALHALSSLAWKWWIPLIALNQHLLVWKYFLTAVPRKQKTLCLLSSLLLLSAVLGIFFLMPFSFSPLKLLPAVIFFLMITEAVNIPHHLGMPLAHGEARHPLRDQALVTRSGYYPWPLSELLFMNFNFHVEHHLYPDLPWFQLREIRKRMCDKAAGEYEEVSGLSWPFRQRRREILDAFSPLPKKSEATRVPRCRRHTVRLLARVLPRIPKSFRHAICRQSILLNYRPSPKLQVKLAEAREEWEAVFALLYETYCSTGLMRENRWGMRVTKYHALPTTSTIIALWDKKVVGTLSIVQDSPMGLPIDSIFDLSSVRTEGNAIAEISALAVKREFQSDGGKILFPITKYMWEYATNYLALDAVVAAVHPRMADFYEAILLMERLSGEVTPSYSFANDNPAVGLVLPFERARNRAYQIYCGKPRNKDLYRYYQGATFSNFYFPERAFFKTFDAKLNPELLYYFLIHRSNVWEELSASEKRLIIAQRGSSNRRYPSRLRGSIKCKETRLEILVRNVSDGGLMAQLPTHCPVDGRVEVELWIGENEKVKVVAHPIWQRERNLGFQILHRPELWGRYVRYLEQEAS